MHTPLSHRNQSPLFMAIELSNSIWKLAFSSGGAAKPRRRDVRGGDIDTLLAEIAHAKERLKLSPDASVVTCYEAGRDGFWIHRCLHSFGIENIVVDPSSIEVNRRFRRAKSDRLDVEKLLSMLIRWKGGEEKVWSVVNPPTPQQEDARQLHRELETLRREQTSHTNRIKGLLVSIGVRIGGISRRFEEDLDQLTLWDGTPLPQEMKERVVREFKRMQLTNQQIRYLEQKRATILRAEEASEAPPSDNATNKVLRLMELRAIGSNSAWLFVHEVFGWRDITSRKQLASLLGLAPTPYSSGDLRRELGISKQGNRRMRTMLIEIAWRWLQFQPCSELSKWYEERFAHGSIRQRKIGIVALSRKLAIALWHYLRAGLIPQGATLKPDDFCQHRYTPSLQ